MENFSKDFHQNYAVDAYRYLGSHFENQLDQSEVTFRVYAPHADRVSVVGDFNNWDEVKNPMKKITDGGIWEAVITGLSNYTKYKYFIDTKGKRIYKQDPYAYHYETDGGTCSKVYNLNGFEFSDHKWLEKRSKTNVFNSPMNIYEIHLGSWKRHFDGNKYNYRELADSLIPYVKKMGYTHIEVMPISEYPFEGSWGYQATGYFAISSRYGVPHDFMYFVNLAHENNIGIIIDWVGAHFAKDSHALIEFDGDYVYEDPNPLRMEHENWGTRVFNYQKSEVKSFLISSAMFFFKKYHIDGIRVDAVASMLYLDYDRKVFETNIYGNNYNLEAISFLKSLNTEVFKCYPDALMIAEESTAFANVSKPVYMNGLGFNFKWNMGWMNDTLGYMQTDMLYRKHHQNKLTFSIVYAFSENFILPISHDEVVHLKKSLLEKMPGSYYEKFANNRAFYGYMMTHPGKKLNFMGTEIGQSNEWNYNNELDWNALKLPKHKQLSRFTKEMNKFYLKNSCLWELDVETGGFEWINGSDSDHNMFIYKRINKRKEELIVIINFAGVPWYDYKVGVAPGNYTEVFNSDKIIYGGSDLTNDNLVTTKHSANFFETSVSINIAALSFIILKINKGGETNV